MTTLKALAIAAAVTLAVSGTALATLFKDNLDDPAKMQNTAPTGLFQDLVRKLVPMNWAAQAGIQDWFTPRPGSVHHAVTPAVGDQTQTATDDTHAPKALID